MLPGTVANSYDFEATVALPSAVDTQVTVEAWDQAGNRTSRELIFNSSAAVGIEIISPFEGAELTTSGATANIDVVVRLTGLSATGKVMVSADSAVATQMEVNDTTANTTLVVSAEDGKHVIKIQVLNELNEVIAQRRTTFSITNSDNLELELSQSEPANLAQNVETQRLHCPLFQ